MNCKEDSIPDSEQPVEKAKEPSVAALRLQKVYVRLTRMPLAEILRSKGARLE